MLAWFKKKFGKQQEPSPPAAPEESQGHLVVDAIPALPADAESTPAEVFAGDSEAAADAPVTMPAIGGAEKKAETTEHTDSCPQVEQAAAISAQHGDLPADPDSAPESTFQDESEDAAQNLPAEETAAQEEKGGGKAVSPSSPEPAFVAAGRPAGGVAAATQSTTDIENTAAEPTAVPFGVFATADDEVPSTSAQATPAPELPTADHPAEEDDAAALDEAVAETGLESGETEDVTDPARGKRSVSSYTQEKPAAKSMFRRLQDRLGKSRSSFVYQLDRLFMGEKEISQDLFDQLEELLITADLGVSTTLELLDKARKRVKRDLLNDPQALKTILREEMLAYITASDQPAELVMPAEGPFVIMVVGVNGVGKTTTIGKIAAKFVRSGQSVLLIAADTFRAAAIDQLKIWGERVGVEVMAQKSGSDPASVVFDGIDYGVAHGKDVILIDTAGRLHTSVNLMEELKKIQRVIGKRLPGAPHEVLQVLDATTGQNGIAQAKLFHEAVGVSGLALTKLDGTAKGGIVANICRELKIPVRFIGIGEQLDDLRDFDAAEFVDALFTESTK